MVTQKIEEDTKNIIDQIYYKRPHINEDKISLTNKVTVLVKVTFISIVTVTFTITITVTIKVKVTVIS